MAAGTTGTVPGGHVCEPGGLIDGRSSLGALRDQKLMLTAVNRTVRVAGSYERGQTVPRIDV